MHEPLRKRIRAILVVVLIAPRSAACAPDGPSSGGGSDDWPSWLKPLEPRFVLGEPAPEFTVPVLTPDPLEPAASDSVWLDDLKGEVVVLDFWDTGCGPCIAEHETLKEVSEEYRPRGVHFFGVTRQDTPASLARFAVRYGGFAYPNLSDPGDAVTQAYQVRGWPTKVVIDRSGRVVWWKSGGPIERSALTAVLEDVLADRRPAPGRGTAYADSSSP